jgi:hypothetical protein
MDTDVPDLTKEPRHCKCCTYGEAAATQRKRPTAFEPDTQFDPIESRLAETA